LLDTKEVLRYYFTQKEAANTAGQGRRHMTGRYSGTIPRKKGGK
jgi:hypothetical protein